MQEIGKTANQHDLYEKSTNRHISMILAKNCKIARSAKSMQKDQRISDQDDPCKIYKKKSRLIRSLLPYEKSIRLIDHDDLCKRLSEYQKIYKIIAKDRKFSTTFAKCQQIGRSKRPKKKHRKIRRSTKYSKKNLKIYDQHNPQKISKKKTSDRYDPSERSVRLVDQHDLCKRTEDLISTIIAIGR